MGVRVKFSELAENLGAGTADFVDNLGEEIRVFACELWELFPDQIAGDDDLADSFVRGSLNQTCSDQTPPSLPAPPFTGGQCPILYRVAFRYGDTPGVPPTLQSGNNVCVLNNIQGPILEAVGTTQGATGQLNVIDANSMLHQCSGGYDPGQDTAVFVTPPVGTPDNCGDPPGEYPVTNPQPSDYQKTININMSDGGTVNYDIEYQPVNYNFPMEFNIGGLSVTLDLGGINFNYSLVGIDGIPLPLPNGNTAPLPTPTDDDNRKFGTKEPLPVNGDNYDEEEKTESDPKEEDVGPELAFVRVTVTNFPVNVKNQNGDQGPNVYYCGWFEFQGEGYNFPRQPIHFLNSVYRKPPGATGYAYTLYEGITGKATIYKLKQEA